MLFFRKLKNSISNFEIRIYLFKYFGRPFMPPYWALGFSVSRYGYKDLEDMKKVSKRFEDNQIPLVCVCEKLTFPKHYVKDIHNIILNIHIINTKEDIITTTKKISNLS